MRTKLVLFIKESCLKLNANNNIYIYITALQKLIVSN